MVRTKQSKMKKSALEIQPETWLKCHNFAPNNTPKQHQKSPQDSIHGGRPKQQ